LSFSTNHKQTNHFNIGSLSKHINSQLFAPLEFQLLISSEIVERGVRLIGNGQAPVQKYWHDLLKLIQNGTIDPLRMVSHRVLLDDLAEVYHKFDKKEDHMQKVFVQTKFSAPPSPGAPHLTRFQQ
jgi:threonine dehydrogenase-like Zn-dependent dehydrogenase